MESFFHLNTNIWEQKNTPSVENQDYYSGFAGYMYIDDDAPEEGNI